MQWFIKFRYKQINLCQVCHLGLVKFRNTRSGDWTQEDISPLDFKSNGLNHSAILVLKSANYFCDFYAIIYQNSL